MAIKGSAMLLIWAVMSLFSHIKAQRYPHYTHKDTIDLNEILTIKPQIGIQNHKNIDLLKFNPKHLPFFCRIEHVIETKSRIPFRFRIGDLNYVNILENKK